MKRHSDGISPIIAIDRNSATSPHQQIYDEFRTAILRGDISPRQKIPSTRALACEIEISRFPVIHAYAHLLAEGYFETRPGAGTFVSNSLPEQLMCVGRQAVSSGQVPSGPRLASQRSSQVPAFESQSSARWGAFVVHQPAFDEFPFKIWSNIVAAQSRNPKANAIHHIDPLGSESFRETICSYLRTARGVKCEASQVMVVSGSQQALGLTALVLFDPGSPVLVEEPGYALGRAALAAAGCQLIPASVDTEGMLVPDSDDPHFHARAALVTPSHQYPLGSSMTVSRRLHLLNWAQRTGAWIIEDDYDSEYRYESSPMSSLQGLDANERVIYVGTFSKVLFPSLRVGYLVIPRDLVQRFVAVRAAMDIFPPYLYQEVLTDFMRLGHFGRHIRKMRQIYGERRTALVRSLRTELGDLLEVHGTDAGMHVTVTLPQGFDDQAIATKAVQDNLWLRPLSPAYLGKDARQGFVLGFGNTPEQLIPDAVRRFRSVLID